ncbi:squalene/phytoene synthase family protein, partial [Micromonospora sp. NPDC049679]|uniref:squalene/phytoene synthase family protein n=1 Tax=Micromonospora sp. NPDC049679 TaxID=3155920 RepID=UPI0033C5ADBB
EARSRRPGRRTAGAPAQEECDPWSRRWRSRTRAATPRIRELIEYEVSRAQAHYVAAAPGVTMLAPASQACMRTAYHLYGGILDEVAAAGYDVFRRRAVVPSLRRVGVAARSLLTGPCNPVQVPGPLAASPRP